MFEVPRVVVLELQALGSGGPELSPLGVLTPLPPRQWRRGSKTHTHGRESKGTRVGLVAFRVGVKFLAAAFPN